MNKNKKHSARYGTREKETNKFFGRISFRTFALSLVALIQIALLLVGATYSWVETISSIKFDGAKGKTATAVKKLINLTDSGSTVSLDNYFNEAGDVHLASCSSADGNDFYFPIVGDSTYRLGTINDKNVNYIDFTFDIKNTTGSNKEFKFNNIPSVNDDVRLAIYLDGAEPLIFANKASTASVISSIDGKTKSTTSVKAFGDYVVNNKDGNNVFTVNTNSQVTVNVKLWLQEGGTSTGDTVSIKDLMLVPGKSGTIVKVAYGENSDSSMGDIYLNSTKGTTSVSVDPEGSDKNVTLNQEASTLQTSGAPYGYKFMGWYDDYECKVKTTSLSSDNVYTATTENKTFYAKFSKLCQIKAIVTQTKSDKKTYLGNVTIGNTTDVSVSDKVPCGETATISATPIDGYSFVGWYGNKDFTEALGVSNPLSIDVPEDKTDLTYYAKFSPKEVTVTAEVKDSTGGKIKYNEITDYKIETKVNFDSSVTFTTENLAETGYVFVGWYSDKDCNKFLSDDAEYTREVNDVSEIATGIQIYAKYRLKQYTVNITAKSYYNDTVVDDSKNKLYGKVRYDYNGISDTDSDITKSLSVEHSKPLTLVAVPNDYCEFVGWYSDLACKTAITDSDGNAITTDEYSPKLDGDDNKTFSFYAKFKIKSKTVSVKVPDKFNAYGKAQIGDSESTTSGTYMYGENITLKATETADKYNKYKFVGWHKNSDCSDDPIVGADGVLVGKEYTITVDGDTTDTYYAEFEIQKKTIKVEPMPNSNCGSVSIKVGNDDKGTQTDIDYGTKIELNATAKGDYELDYWYTLGGDSSEQKLNNTSFVVQEDTQETYYAKFKKKTKTVSVSCNPSEKELSATIMKDGADKGTSSTFEYGDSISIVATTSDNYNFTGWYDNAQCTGKAISTSATYSITVDDNTSDNYYAKFTLKQKTISVALGTDVSGGSVNINGDTSIDANYGSTVNLVATAETNYQFDGWFTTADCSGTAVSIDANYSITVDKDTSAKYYAKFSKMTKTITVAPSSSDGGTVAIMKDGTSKGTSSTFEYGDSITLTATANSDYNFEGWFTTADCSGTAVSTDANYSITVDKDTSAKYYAKFKLNKKTVTINVSAITEGNERWAAYLWNDDKSKTTWVDIKDNTFVVPDGYNNLIICRMNGSTTENNWDNRWNQSTDLVIDNHTKYEATGWGSGNLFNGKWTD